MFHFISNCYKFSIKMSELIYELVFHLTALVEPATLLLSPMSKTSNLVQDAQDFIDAVQKFQNPRIQKQISEEHSISKPEFKLTFEHTSSLRSDQTPFPKLKLTDIRREALTFIETFYFATKKLPSIQDFKDNLPNELLPKKATDWLDFIANLEEPLKNRGIPVYETPPGYLEPNFVLAVNLIINPYDRRAVPAKLKEAGLTTKQWNAMLRIEQNQTYYRKRLDQIFDEDTQNDCKLALQRLIQAGDLQAIKHYHELQNIYRPQDNNNLQVILMAIMEILTLHVSPEIIGKVAESLRSSPKLKAIEVG